jgi:hypothetical protein
VVTRALTRRARRAQRQSLGPLDASAPSSMLKLRGLPFSASAQDIANWFNTGGNGMFNLSQESCAPRFGACSMPLMARVGTGSVG